MLTDAELQGITAQALNLAKRDMEQGQFNFLLASYHEGEGLHRMSKIEKLVIARLGEDWLNKPGAKDIAFTLIQFAILMRPPDATVWVMACNLFEPTPAMAKIPEAEALEIMNGPHRLHHQAVKKGLLQMVDGLAAVGQTAERVCQYTEVGTDRAVSFCDQSELDGRVKMYGRDPDKLMAELERFRKRGMQ